MTRNMQDAVNPQNINPAAVQLVAGYLDGTYAWSAADWARFPNAIHVGIAVRAYYNEGVVLDVETGDATPAEAPGWVQMRRAAGVDPTVYCNLTTWPAVKTAFQAAGVAEPHYWIAKYDGDPTIPAGAVAKQYLGDVAPGIDVSSVADYWPGVDPAPTPTPTTDEEDVMDPVKLDPTPNGGTQWVNQQWTGKAATLNIIANGDGNGCIFVSDPIACWGATGGLGGGNPVNPNLPRVPNGTRVDPNLPGSYVIPAGTLRIDFQYSTTGHGSYQVVAN